MASRAFTLLRPVPYVLTDWLTARVTKLLSSNMRKLKKELSKDLQDEVTQEFLEFLLESMGMAFYLSKGYRKNIEDFEGRYIFEFEGSNGKKRKITSAVFGKDRMEVSEDDMEDWDVRVRFKSADALDRFLFSRDQDIVDSMLKNEVQVEGNLNYIYRFGFFARDLAHRFGM